MKLHPKILAGCAALLGLAGLTQTASAVQYCNDGGAIYVSKYIVLNNMWNKAKSPSGWQCVMNNNSGSPLNWQADYNWPVNGFPYEVKAYPAVISGWHWGSWSSSSGLPVRIWDNKKVTTTGTTAITNAGIQNIAYDLWFHTINNPVGNSTPSDEVMIWTGTYGGAGPIGTFQKNVTIGGTTWKLYKSTGQLAWNVFSYVRASNTSNAAVQLRDFVNDVTYNQKWMANSKFLTSVQFGTEPFSTNGNGKLVVTNYRCDVTNP